MEMEFPNEKCVRIDYDCSNRSRSEDPQNVESESPSDRGIRSNYQFHSMNALEILRETVRVLRHNSPAFMVICALLISPVSAVRLCNVLTNHSMIHKLNIQLLLLTSSCGDPFRSVIKHWCQHISEMAISSVLCFPLYITLALLSKAAVVHTVDCIYSRRKLDFSRFFSFICRIWRRLVLTYLWVCTLLVGCLTLFLVLLVSACNILSILGFPTDLTVYPALMVVLALLLIFANAIIISNLAIVISVLEDVSGPEALLRSGNLIKGQTHVGLLLFLGSTIVMAFVEGLFEHRVKTLSYGDGSSRIWEGPLLVIMYSFLVLIDSMMSAVFYFSCRSSSMEILDGQLHSKPQLVLETTTVPSTDAQ